MTYSKARRGHYVGRVAFFRSEYYYFLRIGRHQFDWPRLVNMRRHRR